MKKTLLIAVLLIAASVLTFTACSKSSPSAANPCNYSFGYNQDNDDNTWSGEYLLGYGFVMSSNVTVSKLSVKLDSTSDYVIGLYTDSGSAPNTLLAQSGIKTGAAGWNTATIPATTLDSGSKYWIVVCSQTSSIRGNELNPATCQYDDYLWSDIVTDGGLPATHTTWNLDDTDGDLKLYAISCN